MPGGIALVPGCIGSSFDRDEARELQELLKQEGWSSEWRAVNMSRGGEVRQLLQEEFDWVVIVATSHKQAELHELPTAEVRKVMDWTLMPMLNILRWISDDHQRLGDAVVCPDVLLYMKEPTGDHSNEIAWDLAYGAAERMIELSHEHECRLWVVDRIRDVADILGDCDYDG